MPSRWWAPERRVGLEQWPTTPGQGTTYQEPFRRLFRNASLARIEPVKFRVKSDLRNHRAIVQPRWLHKALLLCSLSSRPPAVSRRASAACQLFFERGRPALNCPGFRNHEVLLPMASTELSRRQAWVQQLQKREARNFKWSYKRRKVRPTRLADQEIPGPPNRDPAADSRSRPNRESGVPCVTAKSGIG
jgi:hypothetical protein